jgi:hypothetical protein
MIYIYKNTISNEIVTDNITNFIPDDLEIYLDDIFVGTYTNDSEATIYLEFTIPTTDIETFQEKEYKLKIYNHKALIKSELVIVKENTSIEVKQINKTNTIKFYEG